MPTTIKDVLETFSLFENIAPATYQHILDVAHVQSYKAGDYIFREKESIHHFYIVLSGTVSLYKINSNGQSKTVFIFGKDHLLNENVFSPMTTSINCKVYQDCSLLVIHATHMHELLATDFQFTQNIFNHYSKRIRRLYRQVKNATSIIKLEKKLASKLWKLSQDYGVPTPLGVKIDFPITVTALSDLMGSYRETISRSLKLLVEKELIIYEKRYIYIPNPDLLSAFFKAP